MQDQKDIDVAEPEVEAPANGHIEGSAIIDRLREQHGELSEDRHTDIEIPGYNGLLWCRYRLVDWDRLKEIQDNMTRSKNPRKELHSQADTLAEACDQFLVKKGQDLIPLNEEAGTGDAPVRYDTKLAAIIGFDPLDHKGRPTARTCVLRLFNNDFAVSIHHNEVMEWMREARPEEDERLVGESQAARK